MPLLNDIWLLIFFHSDPLCYPSPIGDHDSPHYSIIINIVRVRVNCYGKGLYSIPSIGCVKICDWRSIRISSSIVWTLWRTTKRHPIHRISLCFIHPSSIVCLVGLFDRKPLQCQSGVEWYLRMLMSGGVIQSNVKLALWIKYEDDKWFVKMDRMMTYHVIILIADHNINFIDRALFQIFTSRPKTINESTNLFGRSRMIHIIGQLQLSHFVVCGLISHIVSYNILLHIL